MMVGGGGSPLPLPVPVSPNRDPDAGGFLPQPLPTDLDEGDIWTTVDEVTSQPEDDQGGFLPQV